MWKAMGHPRAVPRFHARVHAHTQTHTHARATSALVRAPARCRAPEKRVRDGSRALRDFGDAALARGQTSQLRSGAGTAKVRPHACHAQPRHLLQWERGRAGDSQ